jgi:AcrR family transcriptional regulator
MDKNMSPKAMPKAQNPSLGTSEKILKAARSLFMERGFSGTSMGQIALKAGVNHSLLFHHFKNKQNLWQEVKQAIFEEGKSIYSHLPSLDQSLEPFLKELITRSILFYKNNPDIVRMINWQRLDSNKEQTAGLTLLKESKNWLDACVHFQQTGEIDQGLKPEFIITLVLAIVGSIAMDPNTFIQDPENNKLYIEFCAQRLYKALKKD